MQSDHGQPVGSGFRLSRWFARAGALLLAVTACVVACRVLLSRRTVPTDALSADLFVFGELFLLPFSLLLLTHGLVWFCLARRLRFSPRGAVVVGTVVSLTGACVVAALLFPAASSRWEWGRFGYGPAVTMKSLAEASRASALAFPPTTKLLDGEIKGGWHTYFILKASMPTAQVDEFLEMQRPPFEWSSITGLAAEPLVLPSNADSVFGLMKRRGWTVSASEMAIFAEANSAPTPSNVCWVMVPRRAGTTAIIYVFWAGT